jgi:hypothetical protein
VTVEGFDFKRFIDTFNFEQLMDFFQTGQYHALLNNKLVWGVGAVFLALIAYPKTRELGTVGIFWTLLAIVYGVGGIVLKNSVISQPGPFILALTLALGAVGYVIWTKLINS